LRKAKLRDKRAEILGRISAYEAQIAQAKHDLAHVVWDLVAKRLASHDSTAEGSTA